MEGKNTYKILFFLVGLLMVANVALLATIWRRPARLPLPPPPPPMAGSRPPVNMREELQLTRDQDEQFRLLERTNRVAIDSIKRLGRDARELFFANLHNANATAAQLDSMAGILGNYHKQIELQTFHHFASFRKLLDSKQQPVFDSVIGDVLRTLPEQPHFKGDGSRRQGPPQGSPPPPGEMGGEGSPPPPPGPPPYP